MTANFQIRVFGHGTEITVNEIIRIATPERERDLPYFSLTPTIWRTSDSAAAMTREFILVYMTEVPKFISFLSLPRAPVSRSLLGWATVYPIRLPCSKSGSFQRSSWVLQVRVNVYKLPLAWSRGSNALFVYMCAIYCCK